MDFVEEVGLWMKGDDGWQILELFSLFQLAPKFPIHNNGLGTVKNKYGNESIYYSPSSFSCLWKYLLFTKSHDEN